MVSEVVVGRESEERAVPGRWAQAPSSFGTGRSLGKVVSEQLSVACLSSEELGGELYEPLWMRRFNEAAVA